MTMNCVNCYREMPDDAKFCPYCGAMQPDKPEGAPAGNQADEAAGSNGAAGTSETAGRDSESWRQGQGTYTGSTDPTGDGGSGFEHGNAQGYREDFGQDHSGQEYQNYNGGYANYPGDNGQKPVSWVPYLVLSIVFTVGSTVCCCPLSLVFGIVAIVYSVKINQASQAGDNETARRMAKMALIWLIAAGVVLVLSVIISAVFGAIVFEELGDEFYYEYHW